MRAGQASSAPTSIGNYYFTVMAWPDRFRTWRRDLEKRVAAEQDVQLELVIGANMMREAAANAPAAEAKRLMTRADALEREDSPQHLRAEIALDEAVLPAMHAYAPRHPLTVYETQQRVFVDRERARFSAWYELFPRSTSPIPGKHGTFKTTIAWLPYISQMGFDILYLPPIHPIGATNRKGPNNSPDGAEGDSGSPWAIGGAAGGHKAVAPELGTLADFRGLVEAATRPRHGDGAGHRAAVLARPPLRQRAPAVVQAPPGRQHSLRREPAQALPGHLPHRLRDRRLAGAVGRARERLPLLDRAGREDLPRRQPAHQAVRVLGVADRAHQGRPPGRPLPGRGVHQPAHHGVRSASCGFSQSYTYFTWRNTKWELERVPHASSRRRRVSDYFRPNFWPNTPDILHEYLQHGGRPAFVIRLILAATLSASYGIYGPAFELGVNRAREPGSGGVPGLGEVRGQALGRQRPELAAAPDRAASTASATRTRPCSATTRCSFYASTTTTCSPT